MSKKEINDKDEDEKAEVKGKEGQYWLYTQTVKDHFFHPRNLFKSDAELEEYRKKADGHGMVGSPACVVPDTSIIAENEIIPINELIQKQRVLGFDGTYNQILQTKSRNYTGDLAILQTKLGKIALTPDHLIFSIKRPTGHKYNYTLNKTNLAPEWNQAGVLKKNDFIIYPRTNSVQDINLVDIKSVKKRYDFKSKALPPKIEINSATMRLFGYFISEGSTRKRLVKSTEVAFSFNINEESYIKDVVQLLDKYFKLKSVIIKDEKQHKCSVMVYSVHLSDLFKEWFGCGAQNKRIPQFMMFLPLEKQRGLICGLWRGDGHINTTRKFPRAGVATISKELANQLKILLLRQGIVPSIYYEGAKISKWAQHQPVYRIHVGDQESLNKIISIVNEDNKNYACRQRNSWFDYDFFYTPITKVSTQKYVGNIYNLETNGTHTYTTDAFSIHNCGDVMEMFIKVDLKTQTIKECKWKTFGCASAIASTSILSEMVKGMKLEEAKKITPADIVKALGGLPARKIHCSVLGDQALRKAIEDYEKKRKEGE